ncbi:hypothetical protein [Acaryochloris thomasi]|nr:hypothetical protein [Acaryochloris thomasi]
MPQRYTVDTNRLVRMNHPTVEQSLGDLNQDILTFLRTTVYISI